MAIKNIELIKLADPMSLSVKQMVGRRFGRLLVVEYLGYFIKYKKHYTHVLKAICDCGKIDVYGSISLKNGDTKSCGCYFFEKNKTIKKTHGHSSNRKKSKTYSSWLAMRNRCYNANSKYYYCYGAVGIKVCDRWVKSFENFLADMGERPEGKTLDRSPDKNGDYEPSNCRWATASEQMRNFSKNKFYTYKGQKLCAGDLEKIGVVTSKTIRHRIDNLGWSVEDAITKPALKGKQTYNKTYKEYGKASKRTN